MVHLLDQILANPAYTSADKHLIKQAFDFASYAHADQKRFSGEDYITHPLHVAYFLSNIGLDAATIAAGLLHDVAEDTDITIEKIRKDFGSDVSFLVEGVTKLRDVSNMANKESVQRNHINSLKKMLFAMAKDTRVILIKLADKYHNMETLKFMDKSSQKRIAMETLDIYAPIAARLGMGRLKGQLEDLAFPYVHPKEYSWLIKTVKGKYADRLEYIDRVRPMIRKYLKDAGIPVLDIHSRVKHYYSLFEKLKRKDMDLDKVFDLVALRVVVPDIKSCYEALGVIHKHYKPLPGHIKDYVALPKPNGYQSLHTTIFCEKGKIVEIQIRTEKMHEYAENGIAAHWAYSEGGKIKNSVANAKEVEWLSQLKNFLTDMKSKDGLTNLKIDFFKNRIFAFTPKGDVKDLPDGATPIDFAYAVHTDLGNALKGAKINGRIVPLSHVLQNGDVVEVLKGKVAKPSFDWLKVVKTTLARRSIQTWFREHNQGEKIETAEVSTPIKNIRVKSPSRSVAVLQGEPLIEGQSGLLYKIAKCCNPKPDQKIKGYMTLNQGVSIHATTCANLKKVNGNSQRIVNAEWSIEK